MRHNTDKNILAPPERFELPTAGFEDQNSSTELRRLGVKDES